MPVQPIAQLLVLQMIYFFYFFFIVFWFVVVGLYVFIKNSYQIIDKNILYMPDLFSIIVNQKYFQ